MYEIQKKKMEYLQKKNFLSQNFTPEIWIFFQSSTKRIITDATRAS